MQNIQQVHQDVVLSVPSGFYNLATTSICPTQGFVRFRPDLSEDALSLLDTPDLLKAITIFTLQGHPEFVQDIVHEIIGAREAKGLVLLIAIVEASSLIYVLNLRSSYY